MTPDIVKLRDSLPTLEPILDRLELELVDDPTWKEPSDTSYLTDADRNNPDIAANVDAMTETNKLIAWFGRDAEGYLGLWRGPNNRSLTEAPVVRLDSEGQYSIVAATVPDFIAIAMPEDEFANTRDTLTKAGFKVGFNPDAIWGALDAFDDDPNAYRNELYEQNRVARGLPRTDEEPEAEDTIVGDGVPEPRDFASGSMSSFPAIAVPDTAAADDFDDDDDDGGGEVAGDLDSDDDLDDDDEEDYAPPPNAKQAVMKPAPAKAAPKAPAKAAAKAPAKKAAAKPAKKAAAKPAKKAAAKAPAKKAAAKAPAKKAAKPAAKKPAKPAKKKKK
ncbi:MAG TPA: hypothetical protein VFV99_23790 [Kofleriaceae bacterium]|nr:hypothetical protein [Kofleriaceae bacterium]